MYTTVFYLVAAICALASAYVLVEQKPTRGNIILALMLGILALVAFLFAIGVLDYTPHVLWGVVGLFRVDHARKGDVLTHDVFNRITRPGL